MDETQGSTTAADQKLVGIGGWLFLPATGLILALIGMPVSLIVSMGLASEVAKAGYRGVYALEMVVGLGMLVFFIYAATRFFVKRSNAPAVMIALYATQLVTQGILHMIESGANAEPFAAESAKALAGSVVQAAIWIPYFCASRRVKATFVN